MKQHSYIIKLLITVFAIYFSPKTGYAQPGKDGALTISQPNQVINHYIPVSTNINAGSNTLTIANSTLFSLCPGDLIMIYQAQGAGMDITNTASYGNITAYNSSGLYEFKYVQSASGNIITTQTTFTNSYAVAGRVQLIKVPQYTTLSVNVGASIIPKSWSDTTIAATAYRFGGLVVIHATSIINNGTITASDRGFRGGAYTNDVGLNMGATSFRSASSTQGGEKGESIFGYQTDYDINANGRYCMGAPANGGGGGNNHNAGGGGGGNGYNGNSWNGYGVMIVNIGNPAVGWSIMPGYINNGNALTNSSGGGHGGCAYADANGNALVDAPGNPVWVGDVRRDVGGFGGKPLTNINPENRIYLGGGGGAPHANNYSSGPGTNGGGIIYLIATTGISGNGSILSNVQAATNASVCSCDAAPGGGAGGSIVIKTGAIVASQVISANGGNGGNQFTLMPPGSYYESEGPGAGGGGGFVAISAGAIVPQVNGGLNGTTVSNALTEMPSNGATQGASGQILPVSTNFVSFLPLVPNAVTASNNGPVCSGSPLVITTTASALSYTWTGPNSTSSTLQTFTISNATQTSAGIYSVQLNFGSCAAAGTATTLVTVNPLPTVSVLGTTICAGQSIILTPTVTSATSYSWAEPNNNNSSASILNIPNANAPNSGNYTLTVTNASGCVNSAIANVSITPTPAIQLLVNAPICSGATLSFTTSGATSYTLAGPNGFLSNMANPFITNAVLASSGVYTLTAINFNCPATATTNVTVNVTPTANIIAPNSQLCVGQSLVLNASGGGSYFWNGPASFTSSLQNPTISSSSANNSGNYSVTITSTNGCSATAVSPAITINLSPTVSVNSASVCIGQQINLNAVSQGSSFLWSGPNGFSSVASSINFNNASANLTGSYNLTVTSAQGCTNITMTTINVSPVPNPSLTSNSPVCAGSTLNLQAAGGNSYLYVGPNGFSTTQQNPSITNVTNAADGIYTVTVSNFGCSASITLPVSIIGSGAGTLTLSNDKLCVPFCSEFSINTIGVSVTSASIIINGQFFSGNNINYCIATAGVYTVGSNFKDSDGCLNSSTTTLTAYPRPVADFVFTPSRPIENIDNVIFTNASTGLNQTNWNWYFTNNDGYTDSTQNTSYLFPNAGSFPVAMLVTNGWGCSDTIIKTIIIGDEFSFYVPNAFTPDGDGLNDVFQPKGVGITKYDLSIFDRWGELLFTSTDFFKGWDGKYKGQPCKTDTYTWKIDLSGSDGKAKYLTGHVTIVK